MLQHPSARCGRQTLDQILDQMTHYNVLPTLINATSEAGAPPILPPQYVHREIIKGSLGPLGRFRSPLDTHTNASTLYLYGAGLATFADWQVRVGVGSRAKLYKYLATAAVQHGFRVRHHAV